MNVRLLRYLLAVLIGLAIQMPSTLAQADIAEGKALFKANCAQCHNRNMVDDLTGPALYGAEERWAEYPREELYQWVRNSQALIAEGQPKAVELWATWKPTVMNNFPTLTDGQIDNILAYVQDVVDNPAVAPGLAGVQGAVAKEGTSRGLYWFLLAMLGVLALILSRVASNLSHMLRVKEGTATGARPTLMDMLTSKTVVGLLIFGLVVLGGFTTVNNAISLGRQQGYAPEQPIKFSHEMHAGIQKIECQYCHDGARRSKHSVIPAANTCMNCHKAIKSGSTHGTAEITKIYASIGYDPMTDKMIDNYMEKDPKEIEAIYKEWIKSNLLTDGDTVVTRRIQKEINNQWDGIVGSLTNDQKFDFRGPIEWIRIHNLPDHVYFNHAQHVAVGQVECQTCHGPIEEMELVEQHSPLSMGWCINCHRETEVKGFSDNPYYAETYKSYHDAIKAGDMEKVTVEDIGGLECQKCHY